MLTIDQREQRLIDDKTLIGRLRARQMANLEVLDRAQVATAMVRGVFLSGWRSRWV